MNSIEKSNMVAAISYADLCDTPVAQFGNWKATNGMVFRTDKSEPLVVLIKEHDNVRFGVLKSDHGLTKEEYANLVDLAQFWHERPGRYDQSGRNRTTEIRLMDLDEMEPLTAPRIAESRKFW